MLNKNMLTNEKVCIDIRKKYYHNTETDNYNASVKKMFKPAPLLDTTDSENPSPYENPAFLCHPCVMFFCHYLCTPVSP